MKKRSIYLSVLIAAAAVITAGFLLDINFIKSTAQATLNAALNPWVASIAAICAFVFINKKNYWFLMLGCALVAAIALQFLVFNKNGISIHTIAIRTLAFMSVVYVLNYIKLLIGK